MSDDIGKLADETISRMKVGNGTVADIPDAELLRRAVTNARSPYTRGAHWRWTAVKDVFCLGSTFSQQLCRRFDLDPDEFVWR